MNQDWNYKLVKFFINRTHLTVLLLALVVITGIFGFSRLRTEGFPELPIPIVIVTTIVPGAGPEAIMDSTIAPLESAVKDVEGVIDISSYSARNASTLVINLSEDVDVDDATQEIRNKAEAVNLPEGARKPEVMVPEAGAPAYVIAVTGEYSIQELLEFSEFKDDLMEINEVKGVGLLNSLKENIYIEIEPQYNTPDVINQIKSADISFPLGEISLDGEKVAISGQSDTETLVDFANLPIFVNNQTFKLKDIANVYQQLDYRGQIHRTGYHLENGDFAMRGALFYEIELDPGTDVLKIDPEVKDVLDKMNEGDDELDYVIVFSMADQTRLQVDEIVNGAFGGKFNSGGAFANAGYLFGGIWLLLVALFIFLDLRSAIITIITIPLSFLMTFALLSFLGIQLNTMVLFSLVLVLGLIVDPAIVILESMKRYLELGATPKESALKAVKTIGNGVFIAVLTSFVVFVPFGVVTGIFGEIIRFIPLTVIPALIASYFVPMIFLTWVGSKLLKSNGKYKMASEDDPNVLWKPAQWFIKINKKILSKKWLQISVVVAGVLLPILIAGALFGSGKIKQVQFAQTEDGYYVTVSIPVEEGMTNFERLEAAKDGEMALAKFNEYYKVFFYTAPAGLGMGEEELVIYVELTELTERDKTATEIAEDIQKNLQKRFGSAARAEVTQEGPPEGDYPVIISIFSQDVNTLFEASEKIAEELESYEEVLDVKYATDDEKETELSFNIDKTAAAVHGLTAPVVFGQINSMLGENRILTIDDTNVIVRVPDDEKPDTLDELKDSFVFSPRGYMVKLDDIGDVVEQEVPGVIQRLDGKRYQQIAARVDDSKNIVEVQRRIDEWVEDNAESMELGAGDFRGGAISGLNFEDAFSQLYAAILFSILITYIIFVVFFRSFIQPFIILISLPLMFVGVFPALVLFTNGQFGFLEVLGIIMLIGIVENVGIFMIDYANQKIDQGMDKKEAIALSSGVRFRPILLTQLTSLMGLLPLAVASPFWRGLAVVVIVGIASSGILALFTTPVVFSWLTRRKAQ